MFRQVSELKQMLARLNADEKRVWGTERNGGEDYTPNMRLIYSMPWPGRLYT